MDYTFDYILQNQHAELLNCNSQNEVFEKQNEIRGLNNQNRIIWQFKSCKKFLDYNRVEEFHSRLPINRPESDMWAKKGQLFMIPQEGIHQLEKQLRKISPENLEFNDLEPYIKYLSWHLSVDVAAGKSKVTNPQNISFPTRWGDNRFIASDKRSREKVEKQIENVKNIYKLLKDPNTDWENTSVLYHETIGVAWSLIQVGLGEMALWMIQPFFELWERELNGRSLISLTCDALFQDYKLRILGTLTWVKAFSYYQMGDEVEYHKALDRYVEYYKTHNHDHYNVNNRVLEAAILVYKYKPTRINKLRVLNIFHNTVSLFMDEPTECVRERGLICFDLIQTLFKEDYEKYNS